jgi:hypothetical protein
LALNVAISDFEGEAYFVPAGEGSRINEHGSFKVKTGPLMAFAANWD